jgi:pSer/pThr/pTyr-binding forkhead associated (FHA) protein
MGRPADEQRPLTRVRLRRRGQELLLAEGSYLLGRDASCHVLLDDAKVSRRHSRLTVRGEHVTIEDLGSMNGVYVNGVRLTSIQPLFDGDWVTIGSEELEVCIGEVRRAREAPSTVDEFTPVPSSSPEETKRRISEPPEDPDTTQRSRALEILASIAERALEAGRLQDAEDLLKTTLLDVLQEASLGHVIEPDSLEFALTYSLRLAELLGKSRWFDYAVDLLKSQRAPCSGATAAALKRTVGKLAMVDVERLQNYAGALRQNASSAEHVSSADRVDEILAEALMKRRA